MNISLTKYKKTYAFISELPQRQESFLADRLDSLEYGFWPHFEYFLENIERWNNNASILKRLSLAAPLSMETQEAWGKWQQFRSAQSEVTTIFLIENYFLGRILEIVPECEKQTPDLEIDLGGQRLMIEVKAQSGQQKGDRHPRANGPCLFEPKDEVDLKSWLFEKKISSRNGKPMKPKTVEGDEKGADILCAMTDIFFFEQEFKSSVSLLCPDSKFIAKKCVLSSSGERLEAHFFAAHYPTDLKLCKLKEIWLYHESRLDEFIALSEGQGFLHDHLS